MLRGFAVSEYQVPSEKKLFDPEIAFFDLPIVGNTFGVACLIIAVSFALIALFTESTVSLDMAGFNGFIEMFKFPIGTLAFFGGLFAFYATNHRSEQQKRSMELSQKSFEATGEQNRFANYYKHKEEFSDYIDDLILSGGKNHPKVNKRHLHKLLFPMCKDGEYKVSRSAVRTFLLHIYSITSQLSMSDNYRE